MAPGMKKGSTDFSNTLETMGSSRNDETKMITYLRSKTSFSVDRKYIRRTISSGNKIEKPDDKWSLFETWDTVRPFFLIRRLSK